LKEGIRNKINKSKQTSHSLNYQTKENKEKIDTIDIKKTVGEIMKKTPKHSRQLSDLDSNRMIIDEDETIIDNDSNSNIDSGDNNNNNNHLFPSIEKVREDNIEEIEIIEDDEEKKVEEEEEEEEKEKEVNGDDEEEEDSDDVYIINLDKSPNKLPENKIPSSTSTPYKTPNRNKNTNTLLQVQNNYLTIENSPLSTRKISNNKTETTYRNHEIHMTTTTTTATTLDQTPELEMDIDIISIGGSSNHSFQQEDSTNGTKEGKTMREEPLNLSSREVTPEVEDPSQSITSVEPNQGDTDDDTILFSSGYSTPSRGGVYTTELEAEKMVQKGETNNLKNIQQLLKRTITTITTPTSNITPRRQVESVTKNTNPMIYNLEEEDEEEEEVGRNDDVDSSRRAIDRKRGEKGGEKGGKEGGEGKKYKQFSMLYSSSLEDKENSDPTHTHLTPHSSKLNNSSEIQSLFSDDRTVLAGGRDDEDSLLNKKDSILHTIDDDDDDDDVIIIDDIHVTKERGSAFDQGQ